jgi:hypothetical protein
MTTDQSSIRINFEELTFFHIWLVTYEFVSHFAVLTGIGVNSKYLGDVERWKDALRNGNLKNY